MQIHGIGTGELTDLRLIYGTNHVLGEHKLLVMGTARPSFRYTKQKAQQYMNEKKEFLRKAPWGENTGECGSEVSPSDQRCGVFADWIGPTELVQGDKTAFVSIIEVHKDDLSSRLDPEVVKIPIKYFDQPGCTGSQPLDGYLEGLVSPAGKKVGDQSLDGWSLVVTRAKDGSGSMQTEVVSARSGTTEGSFQSAQLEFDSSKAADSSYRMGHELPRTEEGKEATCFSFPADGLDSHFTLKVYPHSFLPLTVMLRGFDVHGNVAVLTRVAAISEQMTKYAVGTWPSGTFPMCAHTDSDSCGHLCACWSKCAVLPHGRKCRNKSLQEGYKFVEAEAKTSFFGSDLCGPGQQRRLCVAELESESESKEEKKKSKSIKTMFSNLF